MFNIKSKKRLVVGASIIVLSLALGLFWVLNSRPDNSEVNGITSSDSSSAENENLLNTDTESSSSSTSSLVDDSDLQSTPADASPTSSSQVENKNSQQSSRQNPTPDIDRGEYDKQNEAYNGI